MKSVICGVILYKLLSGVPPFPGYFNEEIIANVKRGVYSMTGPIWENTSNEAKDLISKLLCPEESRFSAFESFNHAWVQGEGVYPSIPDDLYLSTIDNLKAFQSLNRFRDAVLTFISSQIISSQESKNIGELFKVIDTNGDGKLSREEMIEGFKNAADIENIEEYIDKITREADTNHDGFIDLNEFLRQVSIRMFYSVEQL